MAECSEAVGSVSETVTESTDGTGPEVVSRLAFGFQKYFISNYTIYVLY